MCAAFLPYPFLKRLQHERGRNEAGVELNFATNVLGCYLLTKGLAPALAATAAALALLRQLASSPSMGAAAPHGAGSLPASSATCFPGKAAAALAWPKATNLLARRLVCRDRRKDSLRLPKMPWQGHLACLQPPRPKSRQAGLAGSGKWQLLAVTVGKACLVASLANAH